MKEILERVAVVISDPAIRVFWGATSKEVGVMVKAEIKRIRRGHPNAKIRVKVGSLVYEDNV